MTVYQLHVHVLIYIYKQMKTSVLLQNWKIVMLVFLKILNATSFQK
jgi:hypothetical protein